MLSCSLDKYFICTQVLTDRSPLLTQIFSTDCRDALGQMLEAQVLYLHPLRIQLRRTQLLQVRFCSKQICRSSSAWTFIILGSRIRIRSRVKSWIWIRIKVIKPKSRRFRGSEGRGRSNGVAEAQNTALEVRNGAVEGQQTSGRKLGAVSGF